MILQGSHTLLHIVVVKPCILRYRAALLRLYAAPALSGVWWPKRARGQCLRRAGSNNPSCPGDWEQESRKDWSWRGGGAVLLSPGAVSGRKYLVHATLFGRKASNMLTNAQKNWITKYYLGELHFSKIF